MSPVPNPRITPRQTECLDLVALSTIDGISGARLAAIMGCAEKTASRFTQELSRLGLIEASHRGRGAVWRLSAAARRRLPLRAVVPSVWALGDLARAEAEQG